MPHLDYVTLLERSGTDFLTGVTDIDAVVTEDGDVLLYATSRSGAAVSVFSISADGSVQLMDHQGIGGDSEQLALMEIAGVDCAVILGPQGAIPLLYEVNGQGQLTGPATTLGTPSEGLDVLVRVERGADTYLYGFDSTDPSQVQVCRVQSGGTLQPLGTPSVPDGISYLMTVEGGGDPFLLAVSADGTEIRSFAIGANGSLTLRGQAGADEGLGVANISALSMASLADGDYVVVASQGSGSLSVLKMTSNGQLIAVDHVLDDLNTRFDNVTALDSVTVGDRAFVVVGGSDDGISLFELLPGGRLLHLSTFVDDLGITLENVASLAITVLDGQLQIFVGSATETGVTMLSYDLGPQGATRLGTDQNNQIMGSDQGEVLFGRGGNDRIEAGGGNDILMDGSGHDTLYGGAGQDVFVMAADDDLDEIRDFNPNQDLIDLSAWTMLRNIWQLTFQQTSYGARLIYNGEELRIYSSSGEPLSQSQILRPGLINLSRVPVSSPELPANFYGTHGADNLTGNWGANLLIGRSGNDVLSGEDDNDLLLGGMGADRMYGDAGNDELHGQSENDTLYGGDGDDSLYGSWHDDTLYGGNGDDSLHGGSRDDDLFGQAGNDTLEAMTGNDFGQGGAGNDVIRGGPGNDTLYGGSGNDLVAGGNHSDTLYGDAGNDTLRGQEGHDWLEGGSGDDILTGGQHRDSFVFTVNGGSDLVADFTDNQDSLYLDDALWTGTLSKSQVIQQYGRIEGNNAVLEFDDGTTITLQGIQDLQSLPDDMIIF